MASRYYKGFQIVAQVIRGTRGGYGASVTLIREDLTQRKFELPLDDDLCCEEEALSQGMQYGVDLVDGLLPWFDPQSMCGASPAA